MMDPGSVRGRPWAALATDPVRYVGQPLAVVVAADRYAAEDGRDAARAHIDPLPVLLDPTEAAGSDVQLFPGAGNVAAEREFGTPIENAVWDRAVTVTDGRVTSARVGLANAADRPVRAGAAEEELVGRPLDDTRIALAAQAAGDADAEPRPQAYADIAYQRHAVAVLVRRALRQAGG
jgi:CO dehydrogenase flavoprotein subunit